jgi:lipoate-protein ligase A
MRSLDYTFKEPACNLALDEVLLRQADSDDCGEVLRFWESAKPFVVLGLSQRISQEVELERCKDLGVPIQRRCSAGGCVVQGPGCLNFTLILSKEARPEIESIRGSYDYILGRIIESLKIPQLRKAGISDLALGNLKVSGNAQRRHKNHILHHGTLLYGADIPLFSSFIREPRDRPGYRGNRTHDIFITNLALSRETLVNAVANAFMTDSNSTQPGSELIEESRRLAEDKYKQDSWIYRK